MALTAQQLPALKAAILADPVLSVLPMNSDAAVTIAAAFNAASVPAFIVWRTLVSAMKVGEAFDASELAGLTSINTQRLQNLAAWLSGGINPSKPTIRTFFNDIFSGAGGANTRASLLALWKRTATRAEALYATGTGSDGSPGTLVFEGSISYQDVESARNLA